MLGLLVVCSLKNLELVLLADVSVQRARILARNEAVPIWRSSVPFRSLQARLRFHSFPAVRPFALGMIAPVQYSVFHHASSPSWVVDIAGFALVSGVGASVPLTVVCNIHSSLQVIDFSSFTLTLGAVASVQRTVARRTPSS